MAYDSLVLSAIVENLRPELAQGRVNKVHQPDAHTLILRYHGHQGQGRLLISSHPENGRMHKTSVARENPAKAPLFAMVLRKWLEGARILDIGCADGERVAWLDMEAHNDIGDTVRLKLMVEIMGKHSNIVLVDGDNMIIDGIRRYGSSSSRYREVLPGRPYLPPPPLHLLPLPPADEAALAEALYALPDSNIADALRKSVRGISPLLARHVALAAGLAPLTPCEQLGASEIDALYRQLVALRRIIDDGEYQPCLLRDAAGVYTDFAALKPLCWEAASIEPYPSMNDAVEAFYQQREMRQSWQARKQALAKALRKHEQRLDKKISLQTADLHGCEAADSYKEAADLLAAHQWSLSKGQDKALLPSFAGDGEMIEIALDPALDPQENVQRYYRRYAKAKKARVSIEKQLSANREELDYLLSIRQSLEDHESPEELTLIEREAMAAGYYERKAKATGKAGKKAEVRDPAAPLPPRRYTSTDGFTILIGRNNKQNDRLSLKEAAEHDIWLHAQKIPGAHVIIQTLGRETPESTLLQAASYAAWFSDAKLSGQVPVDYTEAGKLKKPPGSRPGFVTYTGQRTLYVAPTEPPKSAEQP